MSRIVRSIVVIAWNRARGRALHAADLRRDILGCFRGLASQRLHLARHDRKAAARVAGARRLDGGIERQEIGLLGNVGDQAHHIADAAGRLVELLDGCVGGFRLADRLDGDRVRLQHLAIDLLHRHRKLLGGGRNVAHIHRCIIRGSGSAGGALRCLIGGRRQRARGDAHLSGYGGELGQRLLDIGAELPNLGNNRVMALRAHACDSGAGLLIGSPCGVNKLAIARASAPISSAASKLGIRRPVRPQPPRSDRRCGPGSADADHANGRRQHRSDSHETYQPGGKPRAPAAASPPPQARAMTNPIKPGRNRRLSHFSLCARVQSLIAHHHAGKLLMSRLPERDA